MVIRGRRLRVLRWAAAATTGAAAVLEKIPSLVEVIERDVDIPEMEELSPRVIQQWKEFRERVTTTGLRISSVSSNASERIAEIPIGDDGQPIPPTRAFQVNAELPYYFQDLADDLVETIRQIVDAWANDRWFPPPEGIDPMSDDHVRLVVWGMERELAREPRNRPHVPLTQLPFKYQRLMAEWRRRLFYDWGITREVWNRGYILAQEIPLDPDYFPIRDYNYSSAPSYEAFSIPY
jgi:hypothetical protein